MAITMKMLAVSALVFAMLALTVVTAVPKEEAPDASEPPIQENEEADSGSNDGEAEVSKPPAEDEEEGEAEVSKPPAEDEEDGPKDKDSGNGTDSHASKGKHKVAKRAIVCPCGWSQYGRRCFRYFPSANTWAISQRTCQFLGGNLASVHNIYQERWLQHLTRRKQAWIGFSDAQQERYWLWVDGTCSKFANWCRGQPDNSRRKQHCALLNWGGRRCWDDMSCTTRLGYVCARNLF